LLKEKHRDGKLVELYLCIHPGIASVFGTTKHVCEQIDITDHLDKSMVLSQLNFNLKKFMSLLILDGVLVETIFEIVYSFDHKKGKQDLVFQEIQNVERAKVW
jgi:hypothetical protein